MTFEDLINKINSEPGVFYSKTHAAKYGHKAAILLGFIIQKHNEAGGLPVYLFRSPCKHLLYKPGESITEQLAFTERELDHALGKIGVKTQRKADCLTKAGINQKPVIFWTDYTRLTYYTIDKSLV